MSKSYFQAKITLQGASSLNSENTEWDCTFTLTDMDGTYTALDVAVGDVIAFDTSVVESGSFTLYEVANITSATSFDATTTLRYMTANNNAFGSPDLLWVVGQDGVISRPSDNYGLLPVVSRDLQLISDKFTEYVQNYNFSKIVDNVNLVQRTNGDNVTLTKGMVVYVPELSATMLRAHGNNTIERARAAGMVMVPTQQGSIGAITCDGTVEMTATEWDALTGSTGGLLTGKAYFLHESISGGISAVPPTAGFVTRVGRALSPTVFDVNLEAPIQL